MSLLVPGMASAAVTCQPGDVVWTATEPGSWFDAASWSTGEVPAIGESVCIPAGTGTATVPAPGDDDSLYLHEVRVAGSLHVDAGAELNAETIWLDGSLTGTADAELSVSNMHLDGRTSPVSFSGFTNDAAVLVTMIGTVSASEIRTALSVQVLGDTTLTAGTSIATSTYLELDSGTLTLDDCSLDVYDLTAAADTVILVEDPGCIFNLMTIIRSNPDAPGSIRIPRSLDVRSFEALQLSGTRLEIAAGATLHVMPHQLAFDEDFDEAISVHVHGTGTATIRGATHKQPWERHQVVPHVGFGQELVIWNDDMPDASPWFNAKSPFSGNNGDNTGGCVDPAVGTWLGTVTIKTETRREWDCSWRAIVDTDGWHGPRYVDDDDVEYAPLRRSELQLVGGTAQLGDTRRVLRITGSGTVHGDVMTYVIEPEGRITVAGALRFDDRQGMNAIILDVADDGTSDVLDLTESPVQDLSDVELWLRSHGQAPTSAGAAWTILPGVQQQPRMLEIYPWTLPPHLEWKLELGSGILRVVERQQTPPDDGEPELDPQPPMPVTPPPSSTPQVTLRALPTHTTGRHVTIRWTATNASQLSVMHRTSDAAGRLPKQRRSQAVSVDARSARVRLTPGRRTCVKVLASSPAETIPSRVRCTTAAFDDRNLRASGFRNVSARWAGSRTLRTARRTGARMTIPVQRARTLTIVATTCRTCGTVQILRGRRVLATRTLRASRTTRAKRITIKLPRSTSRTPLTLRTTNARTVSIDSITPGW